MCCDEALWTTEADVLTGSGLSGESELVWAKEE